MSLTGRLYGLLAEFDNPTDLVRAVRYARESGYRRLDAYTPYPIEELTDALQFHHTRMPLVTFTRELLEMQAEARAKALIKVRQLEESFLTPLENLRAPP